MLILEEKLFCRFILISYITKLWGNVNIWVIDGVGTIQYSKWFALRKQISVHTKRTLEAETPLFDKISCIKQLLPHKALIVSSTTNSMPVRVYHMNIDRSHPESPGNILVEKELSNIHKGVVCFHRQLMRLWQSTPRILTWAKIVLLYKSSNN